MQGGKTESGCGMGCCNSGPVNSSVPGNEYLEDLMKKDEERALLTPPKHVPGTQPPDIVWYVSGEGMSKEEHCDRMSIYAIGESILISWNRRYEPVREVLASKIIPQLKNDVLSDMVQGPAEKVLDTMALAFCECFAAKKEHMDWKKMEFFVKTSLRDKMPDGRDRCPSEARL